MKLDPLRKQLRDYDRAYRAGEPRISDLEYDRLLEELKRLEEQSGEPVPADSPTRRLGDDSVPGLVSVQHRTPMLSIENTYSIGELEDFGVKTGKLLGGEKAAWVVELKIDGVAASLIYEKGLLTRALTRGNGILGDDITHNIRTIRDVPLRLEPSQGKKVPDLLEVRGEVYMRNSDLVLLNEQQQSRGQTVYANTRNVTAGSIRLLDPKICAERHLRFFAHSVGLCDGIQSTNHFDFLKELASYGIPSTPHVKRFDSFAEAAEYCRKLYDPADSEGESFLTELDFEIDGLVLKLDSFELRDKLGTTSKSPRWIIAYKVEKYEATTTVREIRVQVGKTGQITPVAELEPVELAGTVVSRASLHNAEEIERLDLRLGDVVLVEKAGKIIPHVVRVEKHLRNDEELPVYRFPTQCPVCGTKLVKDEGGVYIRCNNHACPAQLKEKLRYFVGRNAMDIEGFGEKLINQMVDKGLLRNFGDFYRLTEQVLMDAKLERMGKRLAVKLLGAIEKSKQRDSAKLLNALSIRHVGNRMAGMLMRHFGSIDRLIAASVDELSNLDEIGPVIAQNVYDFFHCTQGQELVADLKSLGFFAETETQPAPSKGEAVADTVDQAALLAGMTIVVTGTLDHFKRNEIEAVIEQHGGRATSSVSSKTSFVLVGAEPGSKLAKAEKLGVRIVREPEFLEMIQAAQ